MNLMMRLWYGFEYRVHCVDTYLAIMREDFAAANYSENKSLHCLRMLDKLDVERRFAK